MSHFRGVRGRGRRMEESQGVSDVIFVPGEDCGKIIGKAGSKIKELQEMSKARIQVARDGEHDGTRKVEISGDQEGVTEARHLIERLLGLEIAGPDSREGGRSAGDRWDETSYDSEIKQTNVNQYNDVHDDWGVWIETPVESSVTGTDQDDGWNDHEENNSASTYTERNGVSDSVCYKCGQGGHFARDCPQSDGGSRGRADGGSRGRACRGCGQEGHFVRNCPQKPRNGYGRGRGRGSENSNWRAGAEEDSKPSMPFDVILVNSNDVGRIIGRGGSKIREIEDNTECQVKISKDETEFGEVEVTLIGEKVCIKKAKSAIFRCGVNFSGGDEYEETPKPAEEAGVQKHINFGQLVEECQRKARERFERMAPIKKDFYFEQEHIRNMSHGEVARFRLESNNILVQAEDEASGRLPNPVITFEDAFEKFPLILEQIYKQHFVRPSPIQSQAWPVLLSGHDFIGIAQTGTGKTLAFLLPALIHIDNQPEPKEKKFGPRCLVLCPTRELALQIQDEVNKINYKGIKSVCVYGGGNRREQIAVVKKGVQIVVATPGRLNDLIMNEIIDVSTVTYLVLDEADRMLDLGFEPDIRKVLLDIRPDRQTVMTSATWPSGVQRLANKYMTEPVHVHVGTLDLAAVHSVKQEVAFMEEDDKKEGLLYFISQMEPEDKLIVFVGKKVKADDISSDLALMNIMCQCIHGDRMQCDREQALEEFKSGFVRILVATDVASRGLDVKDITHVLNYDFPRNIEEYVHRVGRTGRAGRTGTALTFMTWGDKRNAQNLIDIMTEANQEIPAELQRMARKFEEHKKRDETRRANGEDGGFRRGGGRRGGRGGGRGGFFEDFFC